MKTTLSIMSCKFITWVCKILGPIFKREGSVLPGKFVSKFDKNVLDKISYPDAVIVVSGSSGKGSTVALLAHILEESGKHVVWNKNGSNIKNAVVTLVLNNTKTFSHKMDCDVLLLEMDERYIDGTFKPGTITHMALTNITRDQPSRNVHPEFIYEKIATSLDDGMHLIVNADDPLLARIRYIHGGKITTYGVATTEVSSKDMPNYAVDFSYCPSCHTKLKYESYHYGNLGVYDCPRCSFGRGNPDYEATNVDLNAGTFEVNDNKFKLNKKVFFAVYYTLLAYTIVELIGIKTDDTLRAINENELSSKRGKTYTLGKRKIEMLESKNENALSYLQSLNYIKDQTGKKTVIMGFENVSRRYRYNDLSWLWDVEFELLNDDSVDKIFLIGRFKNDVAVRLDYAGIDKNKIILVEELSSLLEQVENESRGSIFTMVCFDMTEVIMGLLKEREK